MEWIPITDDRQPPHNEQYVHVKDEYGVEMPAIPMYWHNQDKWSGGWILMGDDRVIGPITHWRYIEQPTDEEKG